MFFFNDRTDAYRQMSANLRDGWGLSGKLRYEQGIGDFVRVHNSIEAGCYNNYGFLTADYDADRAGQQLRKRFFLTENPSVTLSREELTLTLSGKYTLSRLRYELTPQNNQTLTDYIVYGMARYKWRDWTVETSLNLQGYKGYSSPEMNRAFPNWKFLVGCKVLKGKGRIDLSRRFAEQAAQLLIHGVGHGAHGIQQRLDAPLRAAQLHLQLRGERRQEEQTPLRAASPGSRFGIQTTKTGVLRDRGTPVLR